TRSRKLRFLRGTMHSARFQSLFIATLALATTLVLGGACSRSTLDDLDAFKEGNGGFGGFHPTSSQSTSTSSSMSTVTSMSTSTNDVGPGPGPGPSSSSTSTSTASSMGCITDQDCTDGDDCTTDKCSGGACSHVLRDD